MQNPNQKLIIGAALLLLVVIGACIVFYKRESETLVSPSSVTLSLTDDQFISVTNDPLGKVIARGDINMDGYEDAIVQKIHCGASCSVGLDVVLNNKNVNAEIALSDAFQPEYNPGGAAKSELINTRIEDGFIYLTGYGLDCGCTEEEWKTITSLKFAFASTNGASQYYLARVTDEDHSSFSLSGYVAYVSPAGAGGCGVLPDGTPTGACPPEYDFLIISDTKTTVNGSLPDMAGFPAISDSHYHYISLKGFSGIIPNEGELVKVQGINNGSITLQPPYTFPMTATSISSDYGTTEMIDDSFNKEIFKTSR
jgi:hypothetical protein